MLPWDGPRGLNPLMHREGNRFMRKGKTVLFVLAVLAALTAVYFFLSSGNSGRPSPFNTPANADTVSAPGNDAAPGAKPPDAAASGFDENAPLKPGESGQASQDAQPAPPERGLAGTAVELVLCLVLIFALVVGLLIFLKKIIPGSHKIFDTNAIEVLGKSHLSSKQAIYLAKIGPRVLVLGVAEHSVNVLSEITDPDEVNSLKALSAHGRVDSITNAFVSIFKRKGREFSADSGPDGAKVQQGLDKIQRYVDKWHKGYST